MKRWMLGLLAVLFSATCVAAQQQPPTPVTPHAGEIPWGVAHLWVRRPRPALRPALLRIRLIGVGEARLPTGQPTTPSSRSRDR